MAGYLVLPEEACDWNGTQPGKVKLNPIRLGLPIWSASLSKTHFLPARLVRRLPLRIG